MMSLHQLETQLQQGTVLPAYLLCGDDDARRDEALRLLEKVIGSHDAPLESVERMDHETTTGRELADIVSTPALLGGRRVVVVTEADRLADTDALERLMASPPDFSTLILVTAKRAKDIPLHKAIEALGGLWEFALPQGQALKRRLQEMAQMRQLTLDRGALGILEERVGDDLRRAELELDKLALYLGNKSQVTAAVADRLVVAGAPEAGRYAMFDYLDAICEGQVQTALMHLQSLLQAGESPLALIGMMARQFRLLIGGLAWRGTTPETLAKAMNMRSSFPAKKAMAQARRWRLPWIHAAIERCVTWDMAIKRGVDGTMALQLLTVELVVDQKAWRGARPAV